MTTNTKTAIENTLDQIDTAVVHLDQMIAAEPTVGRKAALRNIREEFCWAAAYLRHGRIQDAGRTLEAARRNLANLPGRCVA